MATRPPAARPADQLEREVSRAFVRRLSFVVMLFFGLTLAFRMLTWAGDRSGGPAIADLTLQLEIAVVALLLCMLRPTRHLAHVIALLVVASFHAQIALEVVLLGARPGQVALWELCLLMGTSVLLPWGAVPQALSAIAALASLAWVLPVPAPDGSVAAALGLLAGALATVSGAHFLQQERRASLLRTIMLSEEAEIGAALAHVGQTLSANLNRSDMLEKVNRLAVELIGCDWSGTFTWHERPRGYRLGSSFGLRADARTELAMLDFPSEVSPLLRAFRPDRLVEIANDDPQGLIPSHLRRRFDLGAALFAPLYDGNDLAGVLVCAFREPRHTFTERERRLALGIAHATAIAHQNASLIRDLTAASRLKSDFVATMSHELRTPLNIILGYTDLLASGEFGELLPAQREVLTTTRRSAQQLFELVSSTLNLNRMDAGRESVDLDVTNLDDLLAEIAGESKPLVRGGVQLSCANRLGSRMVVTDRVKLKTIVKNLIGNALKFTDHGSVDVLAHAKHGLMVIEVRDTGIGIPEEQLPVIFEMFRQIDSSPTRRHDGVGLGLYIVKRLVDLLGGSVLVASEVGVGSTFTVSLPLTTAGYQIAS
jgi:signal transduction histidine kinase